MKLNKRQKDYLASRRRFKMSMKISSEVANNPDLLFPVIKDFWNGPIKLSDKRRNPNLYKKEWLQMGQLNGDFEHDSFALVILITKKQNDKNRNS
jgi:hypothetical protein